MIKTTQGPVLPVWRLATASLDSCPRPTGFQSFQNYWCWQEDHIQRKVLWRGTPRSPHSEPPAFALRLFVPLFPAQADLDKEEAECLLIALKATPPCSRNLFKSHTVETLLLTACMPCSFLPRSIPSSCPFLCLPDSLGPR